MKRVLSILNLAYRFNVHLLKKPFAADRGLARFLDQYGPEHLLPLSPRRAGCCPGWSRASTAGSATRSASASTRPRGTCTTAPPSWP